jgi:hypothetical protein
MREDLAAREQHPQGARVRELIEDELGMLERHDIFALGHRRDVAVNTLEVARPDDLYVGLERNPVRPTLRGQAVEELRARRRRQRCVHDSLSRVFTPPSITS